MLADMIFVQNFTQIFRLKVLHRKKCVKNQQRKCIKYKKFGHFLVMNELIISMSRECRDEIRIKCTLYFHLYRKSHCFYTAGKNFTLPPALTAWTNLTSRCLCLCCWLAQSAARALVVTSGTCDLLSSFFLLFV